MDFIKKAAIITCFTLFLLSIYHDLFAQNPSSANPNQIEQEVVVYNEDSFDIVQVRIKSGDTVLSIIERINNTEVNREIKTEKIIADFKSLNPNVNPQQLEVNTIYYFPLYN